MTASGNNGEFHGQASAEEQSSPNICGRDNENHWNFAPDNQALFVYCRTHAVTPYATRRSKDAQ
jgi:hypothetical protein